MYTHSLTWRIEKGTSHTPGKPPDPLSTATLDEASQRIPGGAYTTFRTFDRLLVLHLDGHFDRLENTARLAGHRIILDRELIRSHLRAITSYHSESDHRIRLTLDLTSMVGDNYISIEPLRVPTPKIMDHGVKVITRNLQRENPEAKLTGFLIEAANTRRDLPEGIYEVVMVGDEGELLEGLSSNFYGVLCGEIWTAQQGVLPGVTRQIVLEEALRVEFPIRMMAIPSARLPELSEAFLTSSSRAIVPIVEVDRIKIGNGRPGPVVRQLLEAYNRRIRIEARPI